MSILRPYFLPLFVLDASAHYLTHRHPKIEIDEQYFFSQFDKRGSQVHRRRRLPNATLGITNSNHASHSRIRSSCHPGSVSGYGVNSSRDPCFKKIEGMGPPSSGRMTEQKQDEDF